MKEEIEYTSKQYPEIRRSDSQMNKTLSNKSDPTKTKSIIYIDKVKNKIKRAPEYITINDSSDSEGLEDQLEKKPYLRKDTGWYQRFNQELEERERRGELTPPRTTRPISSIKLTKLNKNTIAESLSQENSMTPTQLLYPPSLEKEFLGSQSDMNFFRSCLDEEPTSTLDEKRRIKPSQSVDDIKKTKKLKKLCFDNSYDACNHQEKEVKKENKSKKYFADDIYDDEASDE
jgi:hypothetical protein